MKPEGCPDCGSVRIDLLLVKRDRLRHRCEECRHVWSSERTGVVDARSPNYINVADSP